MLEAGLPQLSQGELKCLCLMITIDLTSCAPGPGPSVLRPDQQAGASRQQCDRSLADPVLTITADYHRGDRFINLIDREDNQTLVISQESHFSHAHTS